MSPREIAALTAAMYTDPIVQHALTQKAEQIRKRQRAAVPVDTGRLRESITVKYDPKTGGRLVGSFGVDYALPVEMGHYTKSGSFVPAQPYIRPSVDGI